MESRDAEIVREMRREGLHSNFSQGLSLALSGMMAAWGIAGIVLFLWPNHAQRVLSVLEAIAATANLTILVRWYRRLKRFRQQLAVEQFIIEIEENLEK